MTPPAPGPRLGPEEALQEETPLNTAFLIQLAGSAVAVALMVAFAAWAKIARPLAPLDDARARARLLEEFPGQAIDALWIASDGRGVLGKSGAAALVLCQLGDGEVARRLPWDQALAAPFRDGRLRLDLHDVGAPRMTLALPAWPPRELAA